MSWGGVVALKPTAVAKSRLGELPVPLRQRLAVCMALDTLTALAEVVDQLVVITDDSRMPGILDRAGIAARLLPEPRPAGMNAALRAGDQALRDDGCQRVLACVGDLPALTAAALRALLQTIEDRQLTRVVVPDHSGVGSTMLAASEAPLDPLFGEDSAARHQASGAVPVLLPDHPQLRADVDSPDDLQAVIGLGLGRHTAGLVGDGRLADYAAVTVAAAPAADNETAPDQAGRSDRYPVITDSGVRLELAASALDPGVRFLRPGQRLHAARVGATLISAWL